MKLMRYEYPKLVNAFDNWLSDPFFGGDLTRAFDSFGSRLGLADDRLATDLYEDEDNYYARFEVPGVKKDALEVQVENGVLAVSYYRESGGGNGENEGQGPARRQSREVAGRAVRLPDGVDANKISAKLEDGVLTVTLTKAEERKPRQITVS